MCGVWGIASLNNKATPDLMETVMRRLMVLSESRGKEASGIAVLQQDDMVVLRKAVPATVLVQESDYKKLVDKYIKGSSSKDIFVIGHSRLVTNGSQYHPNNNQPVAKREIALVHNGIIVNADDIWRTETGIEKSYEVDSEVLVELLHKYMKQDNSIGQAIKTVYNRIYGMASIIALSRDRGCMIAASNNGSLYYCQSKDGDLTIFASEYLILKKLFDSVKTLGGMIDRHNVMQINANKVIVLQGHGQYKKSDMVLVQDGEIFSEKKINIFDEKKYSNFQIDFDAIKKIKRCKKCVLPSTMPFIRFDEEGVCNYCRTYKKQQYRGVAELENWAAKQFPHGKNKTMVSFSGGRDSSYGLHYFVKELGLKPIAYCYDWGMVTDLARRNQSRMCGKLGVEFILVSADIKKKRENIKKNVLAWAHKPDLGMIPLFMAGDKHYFYYANRVCKDNDIGSVLLASNPFETTYFKTGYCGVMPDILRDIDSGLDVERLSVKNVMKLVGYYAKQYIGNDKYINSSIWDTVSAAISYYIIPHNYFRLFDYIPWNEAVVDDVLKREYDWECAKDTDSTWRIGDGTAPFYNYIYCTVAGFTENDTLRSNQIREGMLSREEALKLVYRDNQPRFESLKWYFDTINVDMAEILNVVKGMKKLY